MPNILKLMACLVSAAFLAACAKPDQYPLSGQECGPEDPVQELDASIADCAPSY